MKTIAGFPGQANSVHLVELPKPSLDDIPNGRGGVQGACWEALAVKGARKQPVLWASTSTKNPQYRDVMYVEELIGPDTVNTMPPVTLEAFRDHGRVRASLEEDLQGAHDTMEILAQMHISMTEVTEKLLDEGVRLFAESFDKLLDALLPQGV